MPANTMGRTRTRFIYTFPAGSYRLSANETEKRVTARRTATPGLIVTGEDGVYRITHETSGYAVSEYFSRLKTALEAAQRCGEVMDWTAMDAQSLDRAISERGREFKDSLRKIVREETYAS